MRDTRATVFNDKNAITADPTNSNYVYAVWDRLEFPQQQASARAAERALGYRGPTYFARTSYGGATWEPARMIYDPGGVNQTIGNQIVVLPDGTLINVMDLIYNFKNAKKLRGLNVAVLRSTDKGDTWSDAIVVNRLGTVGTICGRLFSWRLLRPDYLWRQRLPCLLCPSQLGQHKRPHRHLQRAHYRAVARQHKYGERTSQPRRRG